MNGNFKHRFCGNHIIFIQKILTTAMGAVALLLLIALTAFRAQTAVRPPQSISVWEGMYTEEQAKRGEALFLQECSKCHGQQLEGVAEAPSLAGGGFLSQWDGLTVGDLFERLRNTMPQNDPGKLSGQQYADILGFLLKANGFPVGQTEVGTQAEMLSQIQIIQFDPRPEQTPAPAAGSADSGKQLFASVGCADCHGTSAKSGAGPQLTAPQMPLADFVKSIRQPSGKMTPWSQEKVSDTQLADIYAFLQSLKSDSSTGTPTGNADSKKKTQ